MLALFKQEDVSDQVWEKLLLEAISENSE